MNSLEFRLEIPVECEPLVSAPALTFSHWLPTADDEALLTFDTNIEARLYFNVQSTWWASCPTADQIPKQVNVLAHRLWVDVRVDDIAPDLVEYVCKRDYASDHRSLLSNLEAQLEELGYAVFRIAVRTYNRLIDFARSRKGQYWLAQYPVNREAAHLLSRFNAQVRKPGGDWQGFRPSLGMFVSSPIMEERYITQEEWPEIKRWMAEGSRPPLVGNLLAGAEQLAGQGHTRSALTEAVTALEVALFQFAKRPILQRLSNDYSPHRAGVETLYSHVQHLGLSASVGYLLPVLVPEGLVPSAVLDVANRAIAARQNVVHQGQRAVADDALRDFLKGIRSLCEVLGTLTSPEND